MCLCVREKESENMFCHGERVNFVFVCVRERKKAKYVFCSVA